MRQFFCELLAFSVIGLGTEAGFTGVRDQVRNLYRGKPIDRMLPCETWLWSILVFGLSAALAYPALDLTCPQIYAWPWYCRGPVYLLGIYGWEFFWGFATETLLGRCPWQYHDSPSRFRRYVEPWYAGYWFLYGFVLEWVHLRIVPALVTGL